MLNHPAHCELHPGRLFVFTVPPTMTNYDRTTSPEGEGQESSYAVKIWTKIALSEARLEFLDRLVSFDLGLREIQEMTESLTSKFRSDKSKENGDKEGVKLGREMMRMKMRDEKAYHGEMMRVRNVMRKKIVCENGENTRRTRSIIKSLRNEAMR